MPLRYVAWRCTKVSLIIPKRAGRQKGHRSDTSKVQSASPSLIYCSLRRLLKSELPKFNRLMHTCDSNGGGVDCNLYPGISVNVASAVGSLPPPNARALRE